MFNISCVIFLLFMIFPIRESTVRDWLHIKLLFIFFWICSFHAHYHVYIKRTFLQNYINFIWIRVLWIIHFIVYFSLEEVLQGLSRNNPTKKQIDAEIQVTLKNAPAQKRTEEKMFYRLLQQIIKPNCKLTLIASENVFSINFCCFDYFNYCYCNPKILVTKSNYKLTLIALECVIHKFCCLGYLLLLLL